MAHNPLAKNDQPNLPYVFGLLGGSLIFGSGVVMLWYSFGIPEGLMFQNLSVLGASGLDNIGRLPASNYSIGLVLLGALTMIVLNSRAWRYTGGY
ncbi:MAG: hypothetical protein H6734_02270 [Alphaproteobacteria bacterium]|nr:hypothetical protein [Alphaproteobacteria bacterium]